MMKHWASLMRTLPPRRRSGSGSVYLFCPHSHLLFRTGSDMQPPIFLKSGSLLLLLLRGRLSTRATCLSPPAIWAVNEYDLLLDGVSMTSQTKHPLLHGAPGGKRICASLSGAHAGGNAHAPSLSVSSPSPRARGERVRREEEEEERREERLSWEQTWRALCE